MKVCFDVNVIVNLFARTDQIADAVFSYDIALMRNFDVCIPASALADIAYIFHRRGLSAKQVERAIAALFDMFDCIDVNGSDGLRALQNDMHDFEDAIIAESASRNDVDLILTHNVKDYKHSPVPAMAPADFVRIYKPEGYNYAEVDL